MKVIFLSAKNYDNPTNNNGDCILIDTGTELIVYDCGCEEHAKRVIEYMKVNGYKKVKVILSHNDADHFDGIPYLIEKNAVSEVYTILLFKYAEKIKEIINDGRRSKESIIERIKEIYANIYSLKNQVTLKDIFEDTYITSGITIVGPSKGYALKAVAQCIDSRESDYIDKETIVNAVSTQVSVDFGLGKRLLLTGDSSFASIKENIKNHSAIQLPHHGKLDQAEEIFKVKDNSTIYIVSDNTGDSNGGSEKLRRTHRRGHAISYTLDDDVIITYDSFNKTATKGCYFKGI